MMYLRLQNLFIITEISVITALAQTAFLSVGMCQGDIKKIHCPQCTLIHPACCSSRLTPAVQCVFTGGQYFVDVASNREPRRKGTSSVQHMLFMLKIPDSVPGISL